MIGRFDVFRLTLSAFVFFVSCLMRDSVSPAVATASAAEQVGGAAVYAEISVMSVTNSNFISNAVYGTGRGGAIKLIYCILTGSALNFFGNRCIEM